MYNKRQSSREGGGAKASELKEGEHVLNTPYKGLTRAWWEVCAHRPRGQLFLLI